jgi:hypothetical protein
MDQDSLKYDPLTIRPLPKWLTDQRDGLNTIQPVKKELKNDKSLDISMILTTTVVLLVITIFTLFFFKRKKRLT